MNKHSPSTNIAIFDLDKTITRFDTYVRFLLSILRYKPLRVFRCLHLPLAILIFKLKIRDNSWLKEVFLTAFAGGLSRSDIKTISKAFVIDVLENGVYPEALVQIEKHRTLGDRLILASASFDIYINLLGEQLKFDDIVCTKAGWNKDDTLSGLIDGKNCYGENKLESVQTVLSNIENKGRISMYSDHDSDLPVFLLSSTRVATNPNRKLAALAKANNIKIVYWR